VPFTQQPGEKPLILADASGEFASLSNFDHHAENYTLDAHFYIAREQLIAGKQATIAMRTALLLNDTHIPLDLLQNITLKLTSTTLDKVSTTTEAKISKLDPTKDFTHSFSVPEQLAQLDVTFTAEVEKLGGGGERQGLTAFGPVEY